MVLSVIIIGALHIVIHKDQVGQIIVRRIEFVDDFFDVGIRDRLR